MTVQLHRHRRTGQLYVIRREEVREDGVWCVCEWVDVRSGVLLHTGHVERFRPRALQPARYDVLVEIESWR